MQHCTRSQRKGSSKAILAGEVLNPTKQAKYVAVAATQNAIFLKAPYKESRMCVVKFKS